MPIVRSRRYSSKYTTQRTITANDTMVASDQMILCNNTVAIAVTLPSASTVSKSFYTLKDINGKASAYNVTVTPAAGNIDGAANYVIKVDYESATFYSDGSNYWII